MKTATRMLSVSILTGLSFMHSFHSPANTLLSGWTFDGLEGPPKLIPSNIGLYPANLHADGQEGSSDWGNLNSFTGTSLNDPRTSPGSPNNDFAVVNMANNGETIVFKLPTIGYEDISISFAFRGVATGFNIHEWAWSTDGANFTGFGSNTADTSATYITRSLDLSAISGVNDASAIYLRLAVDGATHASGNNRFDNIQITSGNFTWFGTSSTDFTTAANWIPSGFKADYSTAPAAGANVNFHGAPGSMPNLGASDYTLGKVTFNSGTSALTVSGSGTLTLNGGIDNRSGSAQALSTPIALGAGQIWNASAGDLTFSGNVALGSGGTGHQLAITGPNDVMISGNITDGGGTPGSLTKSGDGVLTLNGFNEYSGGTVLSGGTLALGNHDALPPTGVFTMSDGTLRANDMSSYIGVLLLTGNSSIDLTGGTDGQHLSFDGAAFSGGILTILGWEGSAGQSGTGQTIYLRNSGGFDPGLHTASPGFLSSIHFAGFNAGAIQLASGEMVPVPEPATIIAACLLAGFVLWRERKRIRAWMLKRRVLVLSPASPAPSVRPPAVQ